MLTGEPIATPSVSDAAYSGGPVLVVLWVRLHSAGPMLYNVTSAPPL